MTTCSILRIGGAIAEALGSHFARIVQLGVNEALGLGLSLVAFPGCAFVSVTSRPAARIRSRKKGCGIGICLVTCANIHQHDAKRGAGALFPDPRF